MRRLADWRTGGATAIRGSGEFVTVGRGWAVSWDLVATRGLLWGDFATGGRGLRPVDGRGSYNRGAALGGINGSSFP